MMSKKSSNCFARQGLTLIEVIAALGLLATLLVGILVAQDRHVRQIKMARQRLNVVREVDQLLYQWMLVDKAIPKEGTGPLIGDDELVWKIQPMDKESEPLFQIDVVRLEIRRRDDRSGEAPILAVDLAIPAKPKSEEEN